MLITISVVSSAQLPTVSSGTIQRLENFSSQYVTSRNVDVWLPAGYSPGNRYSVLYMHDGQMLFDSTTTWNKQEWGVDEVISRLLKENKIEEVIVVGIWNGGPTRQSDYFPQKPFESLTAEQQAFLYNAGRENGYPVLVIIKSIPTTTSDSLYQS
jgi:enterochelin esterase-like enzyme